MVVISITEYEIIFICSYRVFLLSKINRTNTLYLQNMNANTFAHSPPDCHPLPINQKTQSFFTLKSHPTPKPQKSSTQHYPTTYTAKLYTPTIYDAIARLHKSRNNSLYTLCSALHIYEKYCQIMKANMVEKEDKEGYIEDWDEMGVEGVGDDIDYEWNGEIVAEICYQISQDINQCQHKRKYKQFNEYKQYNRCQPYKPQNANTPSHNAKKLRQKKFHILTTLDWQIHYTTFIDLTYEFFQNHKTTILQYMGKNKQRGLGRNRVYESREKQLQAEIENQIEILLEQWVFLEKEAVQCAKVAVGRVLKEFELEVDCGQLGMFMDGEVQEVIVNIMKSQELQVDNVVQNDLEFIMQNLGVLKQVNRVNSSITASSSSCLSFNSTSCFDFITNNKQINTPPPKLAQLRSKITLSQKTHKYFQPVSILTPQSSILNSVLLQQNRGMQFIVISSSAPCTRHPSFQ